MLLIVCPWLSSRFQGFSLKHSPLNCSSNRFAFRRTGILAAAPFLHATKSTYICINNNYSPKRRWLVVDIYQGHEVARLISTTSHCIQLFQERLLGKVHTTIVKGLVGDFEFSFFQRNLKELARKAMEMCLQVLKESNKSRFDSYSRQEQCIDHIPHFLSGLSRALFFRQPFSK